MPRHRHALEWGEKKKVKEIGKVHALQDWSESSSSPDVCSYILLCLFTVSGGHEWATNGRAVIKGEFGTTKLFFRGVKYDYIESIRFQWHLPGLPLHLKICLKTHETCIYVKEPSVVIVCKATLTNRSSASNLRVLPPPPHLCLCISPVGIYTDRCTEPTPTCTNDTSTYI